MDKFYADPFDTQVTPEEFEEQHIDIDEGVLSENSMPDVCKRRPLPTAIEDIIEENKDDDLSL